MRTEFVHLLGFIRMVIITSLPSSVSKSSRRSRNPFLLIFSFFLFLINFLEAIIIIYLLFLRNLFYCCNTDFLCWLTTLYFVFFLIDLKSIALRLFFDYSCFDIYCLLQKLWFWFVIFSFLFCIPSVIIIIVLYLLLLFLNRSLVLVFAVSEHRSFCLSPWLDLLLFVVF